MNTSLQRLSQNATTSNLMWRYGVFCLVLMVIWGMGSYQLFRTQWRQITVQQRELLTALQATADVGDVIERVNQNKTYLYVSTNGTELMILGDADAGSSTQRRWYRRTVFDARQSQGDSRLTQSPSGQFWIYSAQITPEGDIYLLFQPYQDISQTFFASVTILGVIILMAAVSPYILWRILRHRFVEPLYDLTDVSEAIRWRGYLQDEERQRLQAIVDKQYDTRFLAHALMVMEEEISNRFLQLSTLLNTSQIVVSSLNTEEVLDNILVEVQTLFACDRCAILTLDAQQDTFRIQASRGLSPHYVQHLNIAPSEPNSSSMRALRNQAPIQVADTETDLAYEAFRIRARRENFRSVMSIPLKTTHTPPSVLNLYKDEPYRYSYSERQIAISFGNHASLALENATLFKLSDEQVMRQTRRLVAIVESLTEPLILEGENHEITYMNSQARQLLGIGALEANAPENTIQSVIDLMPGDDSKARYRQAYQKSGMTSADVEIRVNAHTTRDIRIHFFDVQDVRNNHLGRGQLWQDVSKDKQLDRMKSSLVSTVSHELRTPLATIKGYVTTLLAKDVNWDADAQHDFLETILTETDRLAKLVTAILDLSQIESGLIDIRAQATSLNEIVSVILPSFPQDIQARIQLDFDRRIPVTMIDAPRIGTVIRNLIDNAIKYAPDSPIEVRTHYDETRIVCSVRDYGNGIAPIDREKIFERFYRSENGLNRVHGGFGLGLAICKGFVEAHHGQIWFESDGAGTIFSFALPIN